MKRKPFVIKSITPDLPPEEKARRIEHFSDVVAKAFNSKGYCGCKYDTEKNVLIRYWDV